MDYRQYDLSSDKIDSLILSGGGYLGILYLGLIKLMEKYNLIADIKYIYSVSVGSIFALLIALKYTFIEIMELLETDLDINKFISFSAKDILNLPKTFGLTEPDYIEQMAKTILEKKGFNPYINMNDFYNATGIELNMGITLVFKNKYELINYKSRPDIPVWLAIRMTTNLPIIFSPVKDYIYCDLVYDGGHLNNNPIKHYLNGRIISGEYKKNCRDMGTQTGPDAEPEPANPASNTPNETICKKYKLGFICVNLSLNHMKKINTVEELETITFMDYITALIGKYNYNQDACKEKYKNYLLNVECSKFMKLFGFPPKIVYTDIVQVIDDVFPIFEQYYHGLIL